MIIKRQLKCEWNNQHLEKNFNYKIGEEPAEKEEERINTLCVLVLPFQVKNEQWPHSLPINITESNGKLCKHFRFVWEQAKIKPKKREQQHCVQTHIKD